MDLIRGISWRNGRLGVLWNDRLFEKVLSFHDRPSKLWA